MSRRDGPVARRNGPRRGEEGDVASESMFDQNNSSHSVSARHEGTDEEPYRLPTGEPAAMRALALTLIRGGSARNLAGERLHGGRSRARATTVCRWCGRRVAADRWTCACGARRERMGGQR